MLSIKGEKMRVVEMGKIPEKEITCNNCNSILAYIDADVHCEVDELFGEFHSIQEIQCPVCKTNIIISIN